MAVVRFHCPFLGLSGCQDGGGNRLTKTSLITHLRDRHCRGEAQAVTKHSLLSDLVVFERAEVTFKRMGLWLCGVCFKMHTLRSKCRHGNGSDFVWMELFISCFMTLLSLSLFSKGLRTVKSIPPKCRLGFSRVLKGALDEVICKPGDIYCWVSLLVLPLYLLKTFRPRSNLECKSAIKRQRQEESIVNAIRSWGMLGGSLQLLRETLAESSPSLSHVDDEGIDLGERNIKQCKRKISDGHYTAAVRVLSSSGVAPYSDATLEDLKTKHHFKPAPSLPNIPLDHHHLIASSTVVLDMIKSFPHGTSCWRDRLRTQHLMDCLSGSTVAVSDELVSSITQVVNLFLNGSCPKMLDDLQFRVGVSGGSEAILHAVNRLIEGSGDDVGLSILLVDFKNAFNLVDREGSHLIVMPRGAAGRSPWPVSFCLSFTSLDMGLRVYSAGDVLNYAFLASRLQSAGLQSKLLQHTGIIAFRPNFDDALCVFNTSMETDFLSNPSEIAAPKLMKKMEDHTSDWLRTVPISGLGQTMNACSKVFVGDIYGDHAVSCAGIIGIKHRHNIVRDTLVDICYRSGISAGKEVDIGLDGGVTNHYVQQICCFTHGMGDLTSIGYGFLPFFFSSFGELEAGRGYLDEADPEILHNWNFSWLCVNHNTHGKEEDGEAVKIRIRRMELQICVSIPSGSNCPEMSVSDVIYNKQNAESLQGIGMEMMKQAPQDHVYYYTTNDGIDTSIVNSDKRSFNTKFCCSAVLNLLQNQIFSSMGQKKDNLENELARHYTKNWFASRYMKTFRKSIDVKIKDEAEFIEGQD
ncbi:hypothetical protein Tco_0703369 [Tanacetum coccineum]|uniref:Reverse transcriptase domain-containing protein n=1 Tax=Tanacetum coccineum TaxID=301880 RepID=A0ABQ4XYM8_9ASTR